MTLSQRWLAFSGVLSVGAGFLGGMMFSRRGAPGCPEGYPAFGNIYYVGDDVYLDGSAVEFLTARADSSSADEGWTILHFNGRSLFIKKFHDGAVFPQQRGAAYIRRRSTPEPSQARYEIETSSMLGDLGGFGVLKTYHWPSWRAVQEELGGALPQGARKS